MTRKYKSILLASALILSTITPSISLATNNTPATTPASNETITEETTDSTLPPAVSDEDNSATTEVSTQEEEDKKVIGLSSETAKTISVDILTTLKSLTDENGVPIPKFEDAAKYRENTDAYTAILLASLQTYELLYSTSIASDLTKPVTAVKIEGDSYDSIESYITGINVISWVVQSQIEVIKSTEEYDENLVEALQKLLIDTKDFRNPSISETTPMKLEVVRTNVLNLLNNSIPTSLNSYFRYLNKGKDSDDISDLTSTENKESTKKLLTIIRQWANLPHIENAEDSMKLNKIESDNLDWITALADLIAELEKETDGATNAYIDSSDDAVNPIYATSVLGRLGSSLFTVERSANADDDPNRPLTGTLGWVIYEDNKQNATTFDQGPAAKDDFLAMFAATSVYRPFISKIGDRDYYEAYKSLFVEGKELVQDDNEAVRFKESSLGPIDILGQVQNLKKPLYYLDNTSELGNSTLYGYSNEPIRGVTYLLTVKDIIDSIEDKKDIVAVTVNGVFKKESDSWSFYNYSLNKDSGVMGSSSITTNTSSNNGGTKEVSSETTQTTTTPSNNTAVAGVPITSSVVADKQINGGQDYTRTVFEMTFNAKNPGSGLITGALMHNIYYDTVMKSRFKERMGEAVYIDVIGNIVLNDGLVVLPASANPTFWTNPPLLSSNDDSFSSWKYNPYTVAFMDSYPAIYAGGTAPASVSDENDINKYVLNQLNEGLGGTSVAKLKDSFDTSFTLSASTTLVTDFKVEGQIEIQDDIAEELWSDVSVKNDEIIDSNPIWMFGNAHPIRFKNFSLPAGGSVFPYSNTKIVDPEGIESFDLEKVNYESSVIIAKNMYAFIIGEVNGDKASISSASGVSVGGSSNGLLKEGYLFNNVVMPVLTGVSSGAEFDKSNARSDLLMAGGDANVVEGWIIDSTKSVAVFARSFKNLLSISDSNDAGSIKRIYGLLIQYGYYILFFIFILMIFLFLKQNDFMKSVLKSASLLGVAFLSLFVIPLVIPLAVSWTSDIFSRNIVLNAMMANMEMSEDINQQSLAGTSDISLKLYHMSPKQAKQMMHDNLRSEENYLSDKYAVNSNLGLYIEGQEIRLDLYSFWRFNPLIIGVASDVNNPNDVGEDVPQIYNSTHSASKFVSDNKAVLEEIQNNNETLDYYMPFNMIQNGFVNTLNKYLRYYSPPQSIIKYPNGMIKNSYVTNSYIKSLAFLSAEPSVGKVISSSETEEGYSHLGVNKLEVDIVNQYFYPYGDILGLQSWVDTEYDQLPEVYKTSLWVNTLYDSGYYTRTDSINKRLDLANRVNRSAYDFLLRTRDTNGTVSDETLIKLTALFATFEFNKEISSFNNVVYPRAFTLNEISASDIISATLLGQSKQFIFYDTSIVSNVYYEYGIVGLGALLIIMVSLILYSLYVYIILRLVVFGFLTVAIYCIIIDKSIMPALLFILKVLGVYLVSNLIFTLLINFYRYYDNIYIFMSLIGVFIVVMILVMWFFILRRGANSYNKRSWVTKQTNQQYNNNYYGQYNNQDYYNQGYYNEGPYGQQGYNESVNNGLEESEGVYGRQNSHSSRDF